MSTIGYTDWAVDLKNVGAIYPFQGWEIPMVWAAVAFWVIWHIWQLSAENAEMKAKSGHLDTKEAKDAIDRY